MKRGGPLKRSALPPAKAWNLTNGVTVRRGTALKRRRPPASAIRASARGQSCTLGFPCCNGDIATTVWCHSNRLADGKGMGLKAPDQEGCYGCAACHAFLDGGYANAGWERAVVELYFDRARSVSQARLRQQGLL